ncbi:MAG: transcriptional activator, partial [Armatimonadetes bacterium]|nr:transcriptional activator [Armatimonadota bacterium]
MVIRWDIRLLGQLTAARPDETVGKFRTRYTATLLAYLALYRRRSHSREELADLAWPDDEPETARRKLRVALSSLRQQLEPPGTTHGAVLIADRSHVRLNPDTTGTDVEEFEAALGRAERATVLGPAHWQEATAWYSGELLPGHYDDWVLVERSRLRGRFEYALRRLAHAHERSGDLESAVGCLGQLVAAEPYAEEPHRELMRLLASMGRLHEAVQQYQVLSGLLEAELQTTPSRTTYQLLLQIQAGVVPAAAPGLLIEPARPGVASALSPEIGSSGTGSTGTVLRLADARLPVPVTRFFGRTRELSVLTSLLGPEAPGSVDTLPETRLVTLTGPGGVGKTRLSLEVGRALAGSYPGRIAQANLAELESADELLVRVVTAFGLLVAEGGDPFARLAETLSGGPALLILDNAEHLTDDVAHLVSRLLERSGSLKCLVTSRQILNLSGERELALEALPLPAPGASLAYLAANECVRLFVERARLIRPDFQITRNNAEDLARLCVCLEGFPLSLELAAARARLLGPRQMLEQIERRFEFLTTKQRNVPARHRSLRAAIDWSYRLLSPESRNFFRALCVFRGGGFLPAVEAVSAARDAMDQLQELREASLIRVENDFEVRFGMLE